MSPLFGKSEEKQQQDAAAKAEAERLGALSPQDLAAELMPVFGPEGPKPSFSSGGINILQVGMALLKPYPRSVGYLEQLQQPIREGLQVLEHAELILRNTRRDGGTWYSATRLGETALAEGTVAQQIQAHP